MSTILKKSGHELDETVEKFSRYLCFYICGHTVLLFFVAFYRQQPVLALVVISLILNLLMISINTFSRNESLKHNVIALTFMGQIMLLLAAFKNSALIIDIHMYFFAAMGMLTILLDWRAIVWATLAVIFHHYILDFMLPQIVFPEQSGLMRVSLHAVILIIESGVLICLAFMIRAFSNQSEKANIETAQALVQLQQVTQERKEFVENSEKKRKKVLYDMANQFQENIKIALQEVAGSAEQLQKFSQNMRTNALSTQQKADIVAEASVETAQSAVVVSDSTKDLNDTISKITQQIQNVSETVLSAINRSIHASDSIESLNQKSKAIEKIVDFINKIARQINLLALNATIESEQAGESGRGFAVVASEIKNLSLQTRQATNEISKQVSEVIGATQVAVESIIDIQNIINHMKDTSSEVGASIKIQSNATHEIFQKVQNTAEITQRIAVNIADVQHEASETGQISHHVDTLSSKVLRQVYDLQERADEFLNSVKMG